MKNDPSRAAQEFHKEKAAELDEKKKTVKMRKGRAESTEQVIPAAGAAGNWAAGTGRLPSSLAAGAWANERIIVHLHRPCRPPVQLEPRWRSGEQPFTCTTRLSLWLPPKRRLHLSFFLFCPIHFTGKRRNLLKAIQWPFDDFPFYSTTSGLPRRNCYSRPRKVATFLLLATFHPITLTWRIWFQTNFRP